MTAPVTSRTITSQYGACASPRASGRSCHSRLCSSCSTVTKIVAPSPASSPTATAMADSTMIWRAIGVAWGSSAIGWAEVGSAVCGADASLGTCDITVSLHRALHAPRSMRVTLPDR